MPGSADVFEHLIDAFFIDYAHSVRGNAQLDIAFLRLYPKTMGMQVRQKSASRLVHSMADVVPSHRAFACYLAYFGHTRSPEKNRGAFIPKWALQDNKDCAELKAYLSVEEVPMGWHLQPHDREAVFPPVREGQKMSA